MANLKLKGKDLLKLGFPNNQSINVALEVMKRNFATKNTAYVKSVLEDILKNPRQYEGHLTFWSDSRSTAFIYQKLKKDSSTPHVPLIIFLVTTSPKRQKRNSTRLSSCLFR